MPKIAATKESDRMIVLSWNKEDSEETASAEKTFREYIRKGWLAFALMPDDRKKQIFNFDHDFGSVQLVLIVEGG